VPQHRPQAAPGAYYTQQPAAMSTQGTVKTTPNFYAQDDAKALKKAMKGLGCDSKAVLNVLCNRTATERHQIGVAFKTMYGKVRQSIDQSINARRI